ncbi:hypothetical protein EIP86_007049 [Pleurotus ostreatoroseus]|nr:hypothetical protein EIP86_007049 [Pleurotus ostreatoroseus]
MAAVQELRENKLFKEFVHNEEVITSMREVVQVLQEEGFDPNKSSMMIFMTNSRVREKLNRLLSAIQAAGIDPATAKPGMSNTEPNPSAAAHEPGSQVVTDNASAPLRPLPPTHYYSIEYPGYVASTSVPLAVERLGGQASVDTAFKRIAGKTSSLLELHLRPEAAFAHPVAGEVITTNNILLKVVKRRRKRMDPQTEPSGEYTVEAMGVIPKTARFRSKLITYYESISPMMILGMADYQFQFDKHDNIAKLRYAMQSMDVDGVITYRIPDEKEDYTVTVNVEHVHADGALSEQEDTQGSTTELQSNLRLPPPPLFSRQAIPQIYNYKANPASIPTTYIDEASGEEKKRLINRMRWKGFGPIAINFSDKGVPDKPSQIIEEQRSQADQKLLKQLQELFEKRPIWTRTAIFNQFSSAEVREIVK